MSKFWNWFNPIVLITNLVMVFVGYVYDNTPGMILNGLVVLIVMNVMSVNRVTQVVDEANSCKSYR